MAPRTPTAGSFLCPRGRSPKRDLLRDLVKMAISFHARGKLQTQAVNPQYRCPPNGRPGMNGTCSQPDLNTKQRKKNNSDLPYTSAIHKYLQQLQGQQPPSSPIAYTADAHLNERDNAGKSHTEGTGGEERVSRSFITGRSPAWAMGADGSTASDLCERRAERRV